MGGVHNEEACIVCCDTKVVLTTSFKLHQYAGQCFLVLPRAFSDILPAFAIPILLALRIQFSGPMELFSHVNLDFCAKQRGSLDSRFLPGATLK